MKKILFSIILFILILLSVLIIFTNKCFVKYKDLPEKNVINIVMITDFNYVFPLKTAMYSAVVNKNQNSNYHFFVIGSKLNKKEIKEIESISGYGAKVTVLNNKENIFENMGINLNRHVSYADLFKFVIPYIFPKFDKILYLDADIIVQKDLSEFYNTDITGLYGAVVKDPTENFAKILNINTYFCNGVMLLNLKELRKNFIPLKMLYYKKTKDYNGKFMTQDVYNVIFDKKVLFAEPEYNVLIQYIDFDNPDKYFKYFGIDKSKYNNNIEDYLKEAAIIHFGGKNKPWKNKKITHQYIWQKYETALKELENND